MVDKVAETFKKLDQDGDGTLSTAEFKGLFQALGWKSEKIDRLFHVADADKSGTIDVEEFLSWAFHKKAGVALVKKGGPAKCRTQQDLDPDTSDADTDSSISTSEDDEPSKPSKPPPRPKKARTDKPVVSQQRMYELLTFKGGVVHGRASLGDLASLFGRCKRGGFGPDLARLVPQSLERPAGADREAEDLSGFEVGHLGVLVKEKHDATDDDVLARIAETKDACRVMEFENLSQVGIDPETGVGFGDFKRLLSVVSTATLIDEDHIMAQLFWAQVGNFEMPDAMACAVMERVFLKAPGKKQPVLKQKVQSNDFMRMCHVQSLADNTKKQGIPHAQLSLFFSNVVKKLPELLPAREARARVGKAKKKKEKHHKVHKSIQGRIKLSVLMEELFKAMPPGVYKSPLALVLSLLEVADAST